MGLRVNADTPQGSLANQIRDARHAVDLTQAELADHFHVSLRTVQVWEAGGTPRAKHRRALRDWIRFVNCEDAA